VNKGQASRTRKRTTVRSRSPCTIRSRSH